MPGRGHGGGEESNAQIAKFIYPGEGFSQANVKGKKGSREGAFAQGHSFRFRADAQPANGGPVSNAVEEPLELFDRDCQEPNVVTKQKENKEDPEVSLSGRGFGKVGRRAAAQQKLNQVLKVAEAEEGRKR